MKKLFFLLSVLLFPGLTSAESLGNCNIDLLSSVPENNSWEENYFLKGLDGSKWQRGILSNRDNTLEIKEGESSFIKGTGQPNSDIQIFMFLLDHDESGNMIKPSAGNCYNVGKADELGYFAFELSSSVAWGGIEKEFVFDAYTRLEESWDQQDDANTNGNFFIGTTNPMGRLTLTIGEDEKNKVEEIISVGTCQRACEESKTSIIARTLSPNIAIDPTAFDLLGNKNVTILRFPGEHTFYGKVEGESANSLDGSSNTSRFFALQEISLKVSHSEYLKRMIIANTPQLTAQNLQGLASNTGDSGLDTLVSQIKIAMTDAGKRDDALKQILELSSKNTGRKKHALLRADIFASVLPLVSGPSEDWAAKLIENIQYWTGALEANQCIMKDDDSLAKNFRKDDGRSRHAECDSVYVHGLSPRILLHTQEETRLDPDFSDVVVTFANKTFTSGNGWDFTEGNKEEVYYRYESVRPYQGDYIGEPSCIGVDDISKYAEHLSEQVGLFPEEEKMIQKELQETIKSSSGLYTVKVAHPDDISKRFSWKINGEKVSIPQVFFSAEKNGCSEKALGNIPLSFSEERLAFETGVLQ